MGENRRWVPLIVRAKVEVELGQTENKVEYLTELQNFIAGTPPPLEKTGQNEEESVKPKMEYEALCKQFEEMMESYKEENGAGFGEAGGHKIAKRR